LQIIIVGRVIRRHDENMRVTFDINDNTGCSKIVFYQKGENEVPVAL